MTKWSLQEQWPFLSVWFCSIGVDILEDNLVVFYYLSASEIWSDKRDGLWWGGTTVSSSLAFTTLVLMCTDFIDNWNICTIEWWLESKKSLRPYLLFEQLWITRPWTLYINNEITYMFGPWMNSMTIPVLIKHFQQETYMWLNFI